MRSALKTLCIVFISLVILTGCNKESSEKKILSFKFAALNVQATITESPRNIAAIVPFGTDVTSLVPIITISEGATINPAPGIATDFSKTVVYTVTAEDGSQAEYPVHVTVDDNSGDGEDGTPTSVTGTINTNTVWRDLGLKVDYLVEGAIIVTDAALLTVEPGVTIAFSDASSFIDVGQNAALKMVGTSEKPIILKGLDSYPNNGLWDRVIINSDREDNQFEHVRFIGGGYGNTTSERNHGVVRVQGTLSMKHCLIDGSQNSGLSIGYNGFLSAFEDNLITHCNMYPLLTENMNTMGPNLGNDNRFIDNTLNKVCIDFFQFYPNYNFTLRALPIPYLLAWGLQLRGDKTVTIEAGTVFEVMSGKSFQIGDNNNFIAQGTASKPIVFRASDTGSPWNGLFFESTRGDNLMEYCQIKDCGASSDWNCCLFIRRDAKLKLNNNSFGPSQRYGVGIEHIGNWNNVQHQGNTFVGCSGGNVWIDDEGEYNGHAYHHGDVLDQLP